MTIRKKGFTLVELLVVITIIGILAGLAVWGVNGARVPVFNAAVKTSMSNLDIALEQYKTKYGEYPPSLDDQEATVRHYRNRWKRAKPLTYPEIINYSVANMDSTLRIMGPAPLSEEKLAKLRLASLPLWFGGMMDIRNATGPGGKVDTSKAKFVGFSADISDPFKAKVQESLKGRPTIEQMEMIFGGPREETMIDLEVGKNIEMITTVPSFVSRGLPIVYFRASKANGYFINDGNGNLVLPFANLGSDLGIAIPYAKSVGPNGPNWCNEEKYQLVHPGWDKCFGLNRTTDVIAALQDQSTLVFEDLDNVTNFTSSATIEGEVAK